MECEVRAARESDADDVSGGILWALRETDAKDHSRGVIERVEQGFSPSAMPGLMGERKAFVAVVGHRNVGTAGLDGGAVRTVFVAPDAQGRGVGKRLMAVVERAAREAGVAVLEAPSSVTAEPFYAKLGFEVVRDGDHGEERTGASTNGRVEAVPP